MSRNLALCALAVTAVSAAACAAPAYEPEPTSSYQWQRRQEAIERQYQDRQRLCATTQDDDPRKAERCGVAGAQT